MATRTGNLDLEELAADVAAGRTDTVIVAFADMQGRLVGKRTSARRSPATAPRPATTCSPSTWT
jgi:hypothetical protein